MIKLFELIKKNFKLLLRAKISALIIFIGPLLLVSLLGLAYSQSSIFTLSASVYSESYSDLSESLITKMINKDFKVTKEVSFDSCIGAVKRKESQACIIFPPGMNANAQMKSEITFYVDYSQMNIVWLVLDVISAKVSEKSDELSKEMTGDLLSRLGFVEDRLTAGQAKLDSIISAAGHVKNSSETMETGFKRLDITVDFTGIDAASQSGESNNASLILSRAASRASGIIDELKDHLDDMESSVAAIESRVNDSEVTDYLEDIDDDIDSVEEAITNATDSINLDISNASAKLGSIKASFELINTRLSETKVKIDRVRRQRDDLMLEFDRLSSDIDGMMVSISSLDSILAECLEKVSSVKGRSADNIASPITTRIEPIATQKTHFNSLFPTLIVLIIMITGILLATTLVVVEKKSKASFRNHLTPVSSMVFDLSNYFTTLFVLFIQLLLFVSVSAFFFETDVLTSIWVVILIIFIASTVFIYIGMFIGSIFNTEETANLAAITVTTILLLFSSAVIPIESLEGFVKHMALWNPFVISELLIRQTVIFQLGISHVWMNTAILAGYAIAVLALLALTRAALKKASFARFRGFNLGHKVVKDKTASAALVNPVKPTKEQVADGKADSSTEKAV